jgi:serine/threonine protein kinase
LQNNIVQELRLATKAKDAVQQEIKVLSRLEHPNIIHYEGVKWEFNNARVYADYCDGQDLDSYIEHHWK